MQASFAGDQRYESRGCVSCRERFRCARPSLERLESPMRYAHHARFAAATYASALAMFTALSALIWKLDGQRRPLLLLPWGRLAISCIVFAAVLGVFRAATLRFDRRVPPGSSRETLRHEATVMALRLTAVLVVVVLFFRWAIGAGFSWGGLFPAPFAGFSGFLFGTAVIAAYRARELDRYVEVALASGERPLCVAFARSGRAMRAVIAGALTLTDRRLAFRGASIGPHDADIPLATIADVSLRTSVFGLQRIVLHMRTGEERDFLLADAARWMDAMKSLLGSA